MDAPKKKDTGESLDSIAFPIIKGAFEKLKPLEFVPMSSMEDRVKGRRQAVYPVKYDDFRTHQDLEEYIRMQLKIKHNGVKLEAGWLDLTDSATVPLNLWDDVYFTTSTPILSITCHEPHDGCCVRHGATLCELDPEKWPKEVVSTIIERVKMLSGAQPSTETTIT